MYIIYKTYLYLFLILIVVLICEYLNFDIILQNIFFNSSSNLWLINKNGDEFLKFIFYDLAKYILIFIAMINICIVIASYFKNSLLLYRKKAFLVFLAIILIPTFVNSYFCKFFKKSTNIPCPRELQVYNGTLFYTKVFEKSKNIESSRCFPAGHASGGFALIMLTLFARNKDEYKLILKTTLIFAFFMSFYKMLIGDHFLSHTLISMILAFIIKELLYLFKEKNENFISRR